MPENNPYLIVLCTCPDEQTATVIADRLVEEGLAACVNILPGIMSVFQWQGKIEHDDEYLLVIKTQESRYQDLEIMVQQLHPYELPEIIAVSIERGLSGYLEWIDRSTGK
ncbi:MAG: divalent-cation tolerance protein CutA [Gammaproteobacteria bacterium]|nr:divalent-cation tolerance protein CutA [Gammaproteobacteria bacterium]